MSWSRQEEEILTARTLATAAPLDPAEPSVLVDALLLIVMGEPFAIAAASVRSVAVLERLMPLPHAPPEFAGLTTRGGAVLPVFHLGVVLGLSLHALPEHGRMIILGARDDELALVVDAVQSLCCYDPSKLVEPPAAVNERARALIRGVSPEGTPVLDAEVILASDLLIVDTPLPRQGME